jgi:hypothetical protein
LGKSLKNKQPRALINEKTEINQVNHEYISIPPGHLSGRENPNIAQCSQGIDEPEISVGGSEDG